MFQIREVSNTLRFSFSPLTLRREALAEFPIDHLALTHLEIFKRYPSLTLHTNEQPPNDLWAQTEEDSWYYYLAEIALRRIADQMVKIMFTKSGSGHLNISNLHLTELKNL